MITLRNLFLFRGSLPLIEDASLSIHAGQKVGVVGANGTGKSSLFALLRGELAPERGDVEVAAHWTIAHVAQETPALERSRSEERRVGRGGRSGRADEED